MTESITKSAAPKTYATADGQLLVVRDVRPTPAPDDLCVDSRRYRLERISTVAEDEHSPPRDLLDLARMFRGASSTTRAVVVRMLGDIVLGSGVEASTTALSELALVFEMLRDRFPSYEVRPEAMPCGHVDSVTDLGDGTYWLSGWVADELERAPSISLLTPDGQHIAVHPSYLLRRDVNDFLRRQDVVPRAFCAFVRCPSPVRWPCDLVVRFAHSDGQVFESVIASQPAPASFRDELLGLAASAPLPDDGFRRQNVRPALGLLDDRRRRVTRVLRCVEIGAVPKAPEVSMVIPLYRRYDFVLHQLMAFSRDPSLRNAEIVYVVDSPEIADEVLSFASGICDLYGSAARFVVLTQNSGFAVATNFGASCSEAPVILLMNSDVIPIRSGWLPVMTEALDRPQVGVVRPQLLYEDGTLQHAGVYFRRDSNGLFANEHYFKGMHSSLPAAASRRRVPAVTAACMAVRRPVWDELGGLSESYGKGDFEDTDFCLRLAERGLQSWYVPEAALWHLEGQSFQSSDRRAQTLYNMWLHTERFGPQMEQLMNESWHRCFETLLR